MTNTISFSRKNLVIGGTILLTLVLTIGQIVFADVTSSLLPISDGTYLQWSTTGAHYVSVDEPNCDGGSSFVWTTGKDNRDSYDLNLTSIPDGSTITDIEIAPCASHHKTGGSNSVMNIFYRLNDVDSSDTGNYMLSGTVPVELTPSTFSGLSVVKSSQTTLQIGAVLSSGSKGARLSRIAAKITYILLSAPSNLDAINVSGSQNNLSWVDNSSNEDGFKIERSLNNQEGPFSEIASTITDVVSYNDADLTADQTYYYRVRAFNVGGNSDYSNIDHAITATVAPNAPSDLTVITASSTATLNWVDNSTNEEGFKVERSTNNLNFAEIATKGIGVTNHIDPDLSPDTYYYRIRAFNLIGNSSYSNTASTTIF
ncbi:MAG: fibronectin type III domain-containing protein [Candidatus Niyogibacteria bacterium]|nr:fibronectin type III domain-containing protein [Candidatus Niyogibacteria bacterium]